MFHNNLIIIALTSFMTIEEYICFTKFVSIKNYNDWIIDCNLTKVSSLYKCPSRILGNTLFAKVSGFMEILFLPKFQKKNFLQKCDDHFIIPVTLQSFKPSRE